MLLLAVIAWIAFQGAEGPQPPESVPETEAYLPNVGALHQFRRDDAGDRFRLSFGFIDYSGRKHHVSCEIGKRDYERDVTSYGYFQDQMEKQVGERLLELFAQEAESRGVQRYVRFQLEDGTGYRWSWRIPAGTPEDQSERLETRLRAFDDWLDKELPRKKEGLIADYLAERGLRLSGDEISIDYGKEVERGTGPLQACYDALRQEGQGESERRLLGLFLAFVQELRYEIPPDVESGRHTLGFRVPTAVLARGSGDCDSKSAAFCALWRHLPRRAILILVPGHALVGVEGKPRADEAFVRLGNRYFVLCEVAGPGKIPPGGEELSGSFEYVMVEPVG